MHTFTDRLRAVQERVARLAREHHDLLQRAADLEKAGHDHERMRKVLTARVAELERENEVLRKAKPTGGGSADPGTKEKIDELVNEIDRCLALIQS